MVVGIYLVELFLLEKPENLKAKRSIINQIKGKLSSHLPVVVAEVGEQGLWHKAILGVVTVSSDRERAEETIQKARSFIDQNYQVEMVRELVEFENYKF